MAVPEMSCLCGEDSTWRRRVQILQPTGGKWGRRPEHDLVDKWLGTTLRQSGFAHVRYVLFRMVRDIVLAKALAPSFVPSIAPRSKEI